MSIKHKRPSPGKFTTLKSHGDILAKLNFDIEYGDNDITISTKQSPLYLDEYAINIRKQKHKTTCVKLLFNKRTLTIELKDLLLGIDKDDKCRNNTSGSYYIDLVFNLIKVLNNVAPNFKPKYFELTDKSSFDKFKKLPVSKDKPISLSTYKLLTEQRTFYEGYGFIPLLIDNKYNFKFEYDKLEKFLKDRNKILLSPIPELMTIISEILETTNGNHHLYRYLTMPKYVEEGYEIPEPEQIIAEIDQEFLTLYEMVNSTGYNTMNMSEIFTLFVNDNLPELTEICNQIYLIVYYYINIILEFMGNDNYDYTFTYIITNDYSHYTKVDNLYKSNKINRYSEYADFLYSGDKIDVKKAINNISSSISKLSLRPTNLDIKRELTAKLQKFNITHPIHKINTSQSDNLELIKQLSKNKSGKKSIKKLSKSASF